MALHILVVDDNVDVLSVLVEMLQMSGYVVTAVNNGIAMREVLASKGPPVDALVLDCALPGEPSMQLTLDAMELKIPVVMISGSGDAMQFANENSLQLLIKPFKTADLLDAVEAAIASGKFGQRDA